MKILVINPIGDDSWDEKDREIFLRIASKDTEINVVSLDRGPMSIENRESYIEVQPLVKELAIKLHNNYDGIIINCFLDPGVKLLRSLITNKPIIGPGEASLALGSLLGWNLGIVSISGEVLKLIEEQVRVLGYDRRVVTIRGIKTTVTEIIKKWNRVKLELLEESKKALDEGAEVIVLGCTGLAGLSTFIMENLKVPVVDPAAAALKITEVFISLGLRHNLSDYQFRGD